MEEGLMLGFHLTFLSATLCVLLVCSVAALLLRKWMGNRCYLIAYACYKPPDERMLNTEASEYVISKSDPPPESLRFQVNVHIKSGLGQRTYAPNSFFQENVVSSMSEGWLEMQETFVATLDKLFDKSNIRPCDVDILIVNVCCFAPAPSLSAWIVNHYHMREDVRTYNVSGMGCSAGVIALGLARDLLKVHKNSYAVLVSTENLTMNRYEGNDKSMMMSNCLFRVGGSSLLLSNKAVDGSRAKMELVHLVRTHLGQNDQAYNSIVQREDDEDVMGVSLSTYLIEAAGIALKNNITTLASKVLPISEQMYFVYNLLCIKLLKASVKPYVPNFRLAFEHFCIHPGGRAVINGIGKSLKLTDYDTEPAHMTLHRFGNTSSSGLWYELAYMEAKRRVKKGDRVWQIALGSGFKCNTVVWKVLKKPDPCEYNVWSDCIDDYPCTTRNPFELEYKQRFNLLSKQS
ncbi:hypothetical protein SUGI_1068090 [Cryptomeria japonica]|uniref:3-ketoacyl-CoA synthase 1 n=1 Tax=Cryptomeria japonica TaxID=3369 RepID=UPI0024148C5C|nr:3-ketoacyl-CoA synthase 1 [Cryptomeria japonica]GLJ50193.1 hypothetical protein SUGI_1068090 [Cryptomeria japonica]